MQDFRKLHVWHRAQEMCVQIYTFTADFPVEERYGITSQMRKAAVSVGSNIAEGSRRATNPDKARVINIAEGEGSEVVSLLDVSGRLGFGRRGQGAELIRLYDSLGAQIESFRQCLLEGK